MEIRNHCREEEIDLYDLIFFLLKNKLLILATFSVFTLSAVTLAVYKKNTLPNKAAINFNLNLQDTIEQLHYDSDKIIDFKNVFEKDENIRKIYEIENIKLEYEKKAGLGNENIASMKNFIKNSLTVEPVWENSSFENKKNLSYFKMEADMKIDRNSKETFINKYLEILEEDIRTNILEVIEKKYQFEHGKLPSIEAMMEEDTYKKEAASKLYIEVMRELLILKELKIQIEKEKIIEKKSPIYMIIVKDKSVLIIILGMILGIMAGVFIVLIKDFIKDFVKNSRKLTKA